MSTEPLALTVEQVAEALQIGVKQVRRLCRVGRLRHVVIDARGTIRVRPEWITTYLERAAGKPLKEAA